MKETRRYLVSGVVQGVGFRFFTQREADKLGVNGYVRNLPDGRVEVVATGSQEELARLRTLLEKGPRFSSVSEVVEETAEPDQHFEPGFHVA